MCEAQYRRKNNHFLFHTNSCLDLVILLDVQLPGYVYEYYPLCEKGEHMYHFSNSCVHCMHIHVPPPPPPHTHTCSQHVYTHKQHLHTNASLTSILIYVLYIVAWVHIHAIHTIHAHIHNMYSICLSM